MNHFEQHAMVISNHPRLRPALERVRIAASVKPPLLDVMAEQHYRNTSKKNLEIIYTFPVPTGAALLGVEFEIDDRKLVGHVKARRAASEAYDQAVEAGDTAVLVQQQRDGMYTANLGNLKPRARAVIRLRYSTLLEAQGDDWRIAIPTVLAPFYGSAEIDGSIDPRAAPTHSLAAEYPLELSLELHGSNADSLKCVSHASDVTMINGSLRAVLQPGARLDRDVVFLARGSTTPCALVSQDGEGAVIVVSTVLDEADVAAEPASVRLVLDCSGSMAGDSMDWAAVGCQKLIEALHEGDEFSITRFGSGVDQLTPQLVTANSKNREKYGEQLLDVVADLGGTEMETALRAAAALKGDQPRSEVVLLTDGEIWASDALVRWARSSGLRIFVIGVGSSPNHTFLQRLAMETGGSCDFVTPGEDMISAVSRVVDRLRQPRRAQLEVTWPTPPAWTLQLPQVAHAGQAVHIIGGFASMPCGDVAVEQARLSLSSEPFAEQTLTRLIAYQRLLSGHFEDPAEAAERYQLVTEWTHLVAVLERGAEDKATGLPAIAQVEQMVAAGWGGIGRLRLKSLASESRFFESRCDRMMASDSLFFSPGESSDFGTPSLQDENLKAQQDRILQRRRALSQRSDEIARWLRAINRRVVIMSLGSSVSPPTLDWLAAIIPAELVAELRTEAERGAGDEAITYAFIELLGALDLAAVERLSNNAVDWLAAHEPAVISTLNSAREAAQRVFDAFVFGNDLHSERRAAA